MEMDDERDLLVSRFKVLMESFPDLNINCNPETLSLDELKNHYERSKEIALKSFELTEYQPTFMFQMFIVEYFYTSSKLDATYKGFGMKEVTKYKNYKTIDDVKSYANIILAKMRENYQLHQAVIEDKNCISIIGMYLASDEQGLEFLTAMEQNENFNSLPDQLKLLMMMFSKKNQPCCNLITLILQRYILYNI